MAKATRKNIELRFQKKTKTTSPCWVYPWGPKPNNKRSFGPAKSGNDRTSVEYKQALARCLAWLELKESTDAAVRLTDPANALSEYRAQKLFRDNVRACEHATATPFDDVVAARLKDGIYPTLLLVGKKVHYKFDDAGMRNRKGDTAFDVLMPAEDLTILWRDMSKRLPAKLQRNYLESLCARYGIEVPKRATDFPAMWQFLIDDWPAQVEKLTSLFDEMFERGLIYYETAKPPETEVKEQLIPVISWHRLQDII